MAIYYTLTFFRGTRGWPIVLAFLGLLIGLLVCIGLNLKVLESLLNYFFGLSAFAALIIFQPELRRLLAGLGNLTFFGSLREQRENIEVVIQAVDRLSESRIGALVAIEQSTHLQDVVESGITIDCEATPEMIETIFFPNNAIHDGGIIIKEDRILSAACIFPLTRRQDISKTIGTRHRAAIGMSEESDSLVIIVSEETGAISTAHKGQLVQGISLKKLRGTLNSISSLRSVTAIFPPGLNPSRSGQKSQSQGGHHLTWLGNSYSHEISYGRHCPSCSLSWRSGTPSTVANRQTTRSESRIRHWWSPSWKLRSDRPIGNSRGHHQPGKRGQSFTIRILQPPNDTNRYSLEPSEVILELASNADPAPDLTSPAAIKVMVDPIDLPEGINETNINVRVSVPEDAI